MELAEVVAGHERSEDALIGILLDVQERYGHVSPEAVREIAAHLRISENRIYGVASFYPRFRLTRPGRHSVKVCVGTACHVCGGQLAGDALEWELRIQTGQVTEDGRFDLQRVNCLGCCTIGPVVKVDDDVHGRVMVTRLKEILDRYE